MLDPASADQATTDPVGTGPFRLAGWRQGDSIRQEAFAGYRGDTPHFTSTTFRFIVDPTAAFTAIMAGDVDAFPNFPAVATLPQIELAPRFNTMIGTTEGETILATNNARKPQDDTPDRSALLRQAQQMNATD